MFLCPASRHTHCFLSWLRFTATSEIPGRGVYAGFPETSGYLLVRKAATDFPRLDSFSALAEILFLWVVQCKSWAVICQSYSLYLRLGRSLSLPCDRRVAEGSTAHTFPFMLWCFELYKKEVCWIRWKRWVKTQAYSWVCELGHSARRGKAWFKASAWIKVLNNQTAIKHTPGVPFCPPSALTTGLGCHTNFSVS